MPPRFTFNATSLHSGKLVRINRDYFADYTTGMWDTGEIIVSTAVAAFSVFPPVLSPVVIDLSNHNERKIGGASHAPRGKLFLADGGGYGNLGLENVWKRNRTVYISDAGAAFAYSQKGPFLLSSQAMKVIAILQDQIGSLRFRQILNGFEEAAPGSDEHREGFLVSRAYILRPRPAGGLPFVEARAHELAATRTSLSRYAPALGEGLVNWGYVSTDDGCGRPARPSGGANCPIRTRRSNERTQRKGTTWHWICRQGHQVRRCRNRGGRDPDRLRVASVRAVIDVESRGGFLADGRPKLLFERHTIATV